MVAPTYILDGGGTKTKACVTSNGQLVTAPISYDQVSTKTLDTDDVPVNFFRPLAGKQFVITVITLNANKNVATDTVVDIYEALSIDATTVTKSILNVELLKNSSFILPPLNLLISEGMWVNGKADDDDVFVTIMGYYVPTVI